MNRITKRVLLPILAVVIVLFGLSGCYSRDKGNDDSTDTSGADSKVLNLWVGDAAKDCFKEIADAFTAQTGITVNTTLFSDLSATDKLALDGPSGRGGDVYMQGTGGILGTAVEQGLFAPIDSTKLNTEPYTEEGIANFSYNGQLYGIPLGLEVPALIYNKALISEIPDTWEGLIEAVKPMTDFPARKYGLLMEASNPFFTNAISDAYGAYLFKKTDAGYDYNDIGVNNAEGKKAFNIIMNYAFVDKIFPKTMEFAAMQEQFKAGNVAVIYDGPWAVKSYTDAGIDIGIAPLPKVAETGQEPRVYSGGYGLSISAYAKNVDNAYKFIEFAAGNADQVVKYYRLTNRIPALKALLESDEVKNDPIQAGFVAQTYNSMPQPNIPQMEATWSPLINAAKTVLAGQQSADEAMDAAAAAIKENIELMQK